MTGPSARGDGAALGVRLPPEEAPTAIDGPARRALEMLTTEAVRAILAELDRGPARATELEQRLPGFAAGTLRRHRDELVSSGAVARHERGGTSREVTYELTRAGRDLLDVLAVAANWLSSRPDAPVDIEGREASATLSALAEGWRSTIIPRLAHRPHTRSQLERLIGGFTGGELKRRLDGLAGAGLVERVDGERTPRLYRPTWWGRRSVALLAAACRWERTHMPSASMPVSADGLVAVLLLALGLIELPERLTGVAHLVAQANGDDTGRAASVHAVFETGRLVECADGAIPHPDAWAAGTPTDWFTAVLELRPRALKLGGDSELVEAVIEGLHRELVGG